MSESVAGYCPACGGASLFLAVGGHVTCRRDDCPNPTAVDDILDDRETQHVVTFTEADGFTIRHPLRERVDGHLDDCELHEDCRLMNGPPVKPGAYRVWSLGAKQWRWEELLHA